LNSFSNYAQTAGPYYPLGSIGSVPGAYDIFNAYEGMEEKMKNRKILCKIK
jgi:hypothetical protein